MQQFREVSRTRTIHSTETRETNTDTGIDYDNYNLACEKRWVLTCDLEANEVWACRTEKWRLFQTIQCNPIQSIQKTLIIPQGETSERKGALSLQFLASVRNTKDTWLSAEERRMRDGMNISSSHPSSSTQSSSSTSHSSFPPPSSSSFYLILLLLLSYIRLFRWFSGINQSLGAVWKSRWSSWAPVPNKPTVSVDVKQHFNNIFWK